MKIYQDIFNNQEIISDSYPSEMKHDGVVMEVKSRMVVKGEDNVEVYSGNAFGGKNEDEQQGQKAEQEDVYKVNDIVTSFHYEQVNLDKEQFKKYFKEYMKKILEHLQKNNKQRVDGFKAGATEFFKWTLGKFDQFKFYCPSNFDIENHIVLSYYKNQQDEAPHMLYMMDGLKFYKV